MRDSEIFLELIKQKFNERQKLETDVTKVLVMYLAIIGVLIKFSLDSEATIDLRQALSSLGILISVLGFAVCFAVDKIRRNIDSDIIHFNNQLGDPLPNCTQLTLKYNVPIIAIFLIIVISGFIYLLVT